MTQTQKPAAKNSTISHGYDAKYGSFFGRRAHPAAQPDEDTPMSEHPIDFENPHPWPC